MTQYIWTVDLSITPEDLKELCELIDNISNFIHKLYFKFRVTCLSFLITLISFGIETTWYTWTHDTECYQTRLGINAEKNLTDHPHIFVDSKNSICKNFHLQITLHYRPLVCFFMSSDCLFSEWFWSPSIYLDLLIQTGFKG